MSTLENLTWWRNYQQTALTRLKTATMPGERDALRGIATDTSAVVVMLARKLEDESKVDCADAMGALS